VACDVHDPTRVGDKGAISPHPSDLLKVVVSVRRVTDDDDIINIREVNSDHEDVGGNDDPAAVLFPHELPCPKVVVRPVQRIIHPQLFTSDTQGGIKLPPEVGVDPKATPDACAKDDYLLSLHIIDNPSKVGEFPVLDLTAEDVKELDFRSPVRPPDGMVVLESNKVANSIGSVARKQRGCHRNRDQVRLEACAYILDLLIGLAETVPPGIEQVVFVYSK